MNFYRLVVNSLAYYWKTHLSVALGTLFATMALTGSLIVGDCVDGTLRATALKRLGGIQFALTHPSRIFRESLAAELGDSSSITAAPVFCMKAIVRTGDGSSGANNVNVYGVDSQFWKFSSKPSLDFDESKDAVWINRELAQRLSVLNNDELVIRIENPSSISREVPLSTVDDSSLAFRLPVDEVVSDDCMGRFDLNANQTSPLNIFVPLKYLQDRIEKQGKINMLLVGSDNHESDLSIETLNASMQNSWNLTDAQLECRALASRGAYEVRSDRIFLEPTVLNGVKRAIDECPDTLLTSNVFTYFVNELSAGDKITPYSMAAAIEANNGQTPLYPEIQNLPENGIVINEWLANDLGVKRGDKLTLRYNVLGSMRRLVERERVFIVSDVVAMSNPLCDPTLMPDFPGISNTEHCRDWDPGFIIDLKKIRDKDEEYWDEYRGTPKAFVSLKAGQEMWGNRFGDRTAIRFTDGRNNLSRIETILSHSLIPADFGLQFQPVRKIALQAVDRAMNFAPLFIGLSFFLIVSAVVLTALLFVLAVERRSRQSGVLYALGFTQKRIRRLYLGEGFALSAMGSALGVIAALVYSRCMIWALSTVWSGAVADIHFEMTLSTTTVLTGFLIGVVMSFLAIGYVVRRQSKSSIYSLLSNREGRSAFNRNASRIGMWLTSLCFILTFALLIFVSPSDPTTAAGQFFGIGALLLIGSLGLCHIYLVRTIKQRDSGSFSLSSLRQKNVGRRRGRSLSVIGVLASGCFLIIAVGANRKDALNDTNIRSSGTGGFTYYCETTMPLLYDLNTEEGCNEFGLSRTDVPDLMVYPLRLREGDDASCLNLNRAQNPKLIGVDCDRFSSLGAFQFVSVIQGDMRSETAWKLLNRETEDGSIPAVVDQATAMWAIGKSLGDRLTYTDERGESFELQLVGFLANSIFQGGVLISEKQFLQRYPSADGYRIALMDVPRAEREEYRNTLTKALQDVGLDMTLASKRLESFMEVENTYLAIFQFLGGLGLILGCVGVGVVVSRNILERRSEFALMRAVGFTRAAIRRIVVREFAFLVVVGVCCGALAGLVSVLPSLRFYSTSFPYVSLLLTMTFILVSGLASVYVSTVIALREDLLTALRSE